MSTLLSQRQAAAYLGISHSHFRRELAHRLPRVWLGGQTWRYRQEDLDQWVDEHLVQPSDARARSTRRDSRSPLENWATSFRRGTMARLQWSDVDFEAGTVTVRPSADKRQHGRIVPLTMEALVALRSLKGDEDRVGLIFGKRDWRSTLRAAATKVGLPKPKKIGNHTIRHSRLTDLASRSRNIAAIQHMAGHKDLASTMRYVHGALEGARDLLQEVGEEVQTS